MDQSFGKEEHLKSRKLIGELFKKGKVVKGYPLIALYMPLDTSYRHHKVAVSVPKRRFKKAVDRNLIKRRIRECYRLNKTILLGEDFLPQAIIFIYIKNEEANFEQIEGQMKQILVKLRKAMTDMAHKQSQK